jgi:hypothetical protein
MSKLKTLPFLMGAFMMSTQPLLGLAETSTLMGSAKTENEAPALPKLGELPTKQADPNIKSIEQAADQSPKKTFKDHIKGLKPELLGYGGFFSITMKDPRNGQKAELASDSNFGAELGLGKTLPWQELFVSVHGRFEQRSISVPKNTEVKPRSIQATEFEARVGRTFADMVHFSLGYESAIQNAFKKMVQSEFKFSDIRVHQFNLRARFQYPVGRFFPSVQLKGTLSLPYSFDGYKGALGYGFEPILGLATKFDAVELGIFGKFFMNIREVSEFQWNTMGFSFGGMLNYTF